MITKIMIHAFFYKNKLYKNTQAEIFPKFKKTGLSLFSPQSFRLNARIGISTFFALYNYIQDSQLRRLEIGKKLRTAQPQPKVTGSYKK